jgi:hypothetical protein
MTASFIHVDIPAGHAGIARAEALIDRVRRGLRGGRGWIVLLMAVIVASLLVAANEFASASPEGGAMLAWIVLCGVVFVGLALAAGLARSVGRRFAGALRKGRADRQLMELARRDPRVMRELQAIASYQESMQPEAAVWFASLGRYH